jgi:hypothetical protein|tara:strand:+ start:127 stop:366 length:240 start_codon:yes stop_codon:yes gene_type:complete
VEVVEDQVLHQEHQEQQCLVQLEILLLKTLLKVIQVVQEFQMDLHFLVQLVEVVEQLPLDLTLQMELEEMEVQEHLTQF